MIRAVICPFCGCRIPLSHLGAACLHHFAVKTNGKWVILCPVPNGVRGFSVFGVANNRVTYAQFRYT